MDFDSISAKWQKKWLEAGIWKSAPVKGKKSFFMIFAYPGISGYLHVGHLRGFTYTDIITRFKRMQGFNVIFPVGTHATGNQAIAFASKVKKKDKDWIEYLLSNGYPKAKLKELENERNVVEYFNKIYVEDYWKKFGFLADWERFACTIHEDYNKFIEWQFKKLKEKNLLVQKPYFAPFCPKDGPVAVDPSETDISKGGKAEKNEYTLLKFKFEGKGITENSFIVAATLRPETVFGQTNLWVDAEQEYAVIQVGKEKWIASKAAAEKLAYQKPDVKSIGSIKGKDLTGKYAVAPGIERKIIILPSTFCDPNVGTGIVTSVPGDAPDDWMGLVDLKNSKELCKKYALDWNEINSMQPIAIIKTEGFATDFPALEICERLGIKSSKEREKLEEAKKEAYSTGFFKGVMLSAAGKYAGMKVQEAKEKVKEELIAKGKADVMHDFSEEVICRCGTKVVIKKIPDQWFIKYSDEKLTKESKQHAKEMNILPKEFHNNIEGILDWFQDRACARLGNWLGTKMPFDSKWTVEPISDSTLYPCYYIVSKFVNLKKISAKNLTEEFFDFVFLGKGNAKDVSKKCGANEKILEEIRAEAEYFLPLDINLGGKEHQTVHFPVFIMNHVAVLPKKFWPKGIFVNWWVIGKGSKISKSKGGAQPIPGAIKEFSVDGMRLYYANIGSSFVDIAWDEEKALNYRKTLERIYAQIGELMEMKSEVTKSSSKDSGKIHSSSIDSWLEARINQAVNEATISLNEFDFRSASEKIYFSLPNDFKWFVRRGGKNNAALQTALTAWIKLMAPFTPHIAEELWEKMKQKGFVSVASWPETAKKADETAMEKESLILLVLEDVKNIKELTKISSPKKITIISSPKWKWIALKEVSSKLSAPDFGQAMKIASSLNEAKAHAKEMPKFIQSILKKLPEFKEKKEFDEFNALNEAKAFLEKELNTEIELIKAEEAKEKYSVKAGNASPLKPAILLE